MECYETTVELLEGICVRLEHRLLEYTSPYLNDWLRQNQSGLGAEQTPHFTGRENNDTGEFASNMITGKSLEQNSSDREGKNRADIDMMISILNRIVDNLKRLNMSAVLNGFDTLFSYLAIDGEKLKNIKDHLLAKMNGIVGVIGGG